jgi:predicted MPP superfamily phosphohydrolase
MFSRSGFRLFLLIFLLCGIIQPALSLPGERTATYSFIHISDLQSLTTHCPETLNLTFSRIESLKNTCNISAIIITGDVVNTWDDMTDWDAYSRARNLTTIPVYEIAGNHDTGGGTRYQYYTGRTGMPVENSVTSLEDFDFVGINYAGGTLTPAEFSRLRQFLIESPRSHAIIATHYYMDEDMTLSPLGKDIDTFLVVKPAIILMGHVHANFIKQRTVGGFATVTDMTNYQDGIPGGTTGLDYSAGTLYTITSANGQVETITARVVHIYPTPSFDDEMTVFTRNPGAPSSAVRVAKTLIPSPAYPVSSCRSGDLFCTINDFFLQDWINVRQFFS